MRLPRFERLLCGCREHPCKHSGRVVRGAEVEFDDPTKRELLAKFDEIDRLMLVASLAAQNYVVRR